MDKNSRPKIYGLIGFPVKHSLSPVIHNTAFKELGINAKYHLFEVKAQELEIFLLGSLQVKDMDGVPFSSNDIVGFNVTIPHKVPALLVNITIVTQPEVVLCGAVNTVKRGDGKLYYYNTDASGFIKSLHEDLRFNTEGRKIFIFGCGGAGRAIIAGLTEQGANVKEIFVYDPDSGAITSAKKHFSRFSIDNKIEFIPAEQITHTIENSDLLINASPVGMKEGDGSPVDKRLLRRELYVYDVVYNRKTQLIKDAELMGLAAVDGLGMLLHQGVRALEIWLEQKIPTAIVSKMRKALTEAIYK